MNAWRVVELLGVLAEETRYAIVAMLVQAGEDGLPQNRVLSKSGLPLPRLKRHLAKLVQAGLVRRNHRRKGVVWKIDERQLGDLMATMAAKLAPQIDPPERVIEIEAPKAFRTLASKLAAVSPRERRSMPRSKTLAHRRLPSRLTEAIAKEAGTDRLNPDMAPPAPVAAPPARLALPPPEPVKTPAPSPAKRRHPVRLSDAIAESSS